jgi:hypothetical protein
VRKCKNFIFRDFVKIFEIVKNKNDGKKTFFIDEQSNEFLPMKVQII